MPKAMTIAILLACCAAASADGTNTNSVSTAQSDDRPDITTLSGVTYEHCKVTRVEPDGLSVFHSKGIAKIGFTDLPVEYATRYGYDPTKASEYSRQIAEARRHAAARHETERQRKELAAARAELLQSVKSDGVAAVSKIMWIKGEEMIIYDDPVDKDKVAYVLGAPQHLQNNDVFVGVLYPAGTYAGPRYKGKIPAYGTSPEKALEFMMKE